MTNVPAAAFDPVGLIVPSESEIKAGLWADFQSAFDGGLNQSDATPQGQLVAALTAVIGASNDLLLEYVNQVDPAFSSGRMQDAIARIYYLTRKEALDTIVTCTCTGAVGAVIPQGSLAVASDGTVYASLSAATIPPAGTIDVPFSALTSGPIPCPAGSLNAIYRAVSGWDTVSNAADGVIGRDTESRAQFEARRAESVAVNATGILPAIRGAVMNVEDVIDAYVTENATGTSATIGSVSIAARSLYVAVYGGADADIAAAIWARKPPGCGYVGGTTVTVVDNRSGYNLPYPSYSVKFQRAAALPVYIAITIADNGLVPSDAVAKIRAAVQAAFSGDDGGPRARIGSTLYALRYVAGIQAVGSWAQIISITIGTSASPTAADILIPIDKMPTLDDAHITVTLA